MRSASRTSRNPSVASYTSPRHCSSSKMFILIVGLWSVVIRRGRPSSIVGDQDHRQRPIWLLYQSMAVSRRMFLKTLAATGVGAVAGTGAYGYVHGRRDLQVTRAVVPVAGLPPALT